MAGQEETCWRCGTTWLAPAVEEWIADPPERTPLRLIRGGAAPEVAPLSTVERLARLRAEANA
jgi:hypothetical protein